MRKQIAVIMTVGLFAGGGIVYAHVTGAFGNYLANPNDTKSIEKLTKELGETKNEIEQLRPQYETLKTDYDKREQTAIHKLMFYSSMGTDAWVQFLQTAKDPVDMLGNQYLMEKNISTYINELDGLYRQYYQVKVTKETLEGHTDVLNMIQGNLNKREEMIQKSHYEGMEEALNNQLLTNLLDMYWETYAVDLGTYLVQDNEKIYQNPATYLTRHNENEPYILNEQTLNAKSNLTYHIRSDHVYVHYQKQKADVILLGVFGKMNAKVARVNWEAGFLNGFALPESALKEMMRLSETLSVNYYALEPTSKGFSTEQQSGRILITPNEVSKR